MKFSHKLLLITFLVTILNSCTNKFEEINTNPDAITVASPEELFTGSVKKGLDLIGGTMNDQIFNSYASYYGGKGGQFNRYFFTESGLDNFWRQFYVDILKNNQDIIDNYSTDPGYTNSEGGQIKEPAEFVKRMNKLMLG